MHLWFIRPTQPNPTLPNPLYLLTQIYPPTLRSIPNKVFTVWKAHSQELHKGEIRIYVYGLKLTLFPSDLSASH